MRQGSRMGGEKAVNSGFLYQGYRKMIILIFFFLLFFVFKFSSVHMQFSNKIEFYLRGQIIDVISKVFLIEKQDCFQIYS